MQSLHERSRFRRFWYAWLALLLVLLVGCPAERSVSLGVSLFVASDEYVRPGSSVRLTWDAVARDDVCFLQATRSSGVEASNSVPCVGYRDVVVDEAVTYQLAAWKGGDTYDQRLVTLRVQSDQVEVVVLPTAFEAAKGGSRLSRQPCPGRRTPA